MTKSEVKNAIKVVMCDVIDECHRRSSSFPSSGKEQVFQIATEAESLMDELIVEINQVKQLSGYSINNPEILKIKQKLNKESLDYLNRLHEIEHH
jgi:hypothetical protein